MDPIKNPFSPGAGSPPPELVGRDNLIKQTRILLGRVALKRPEKSILLTGLRGVGKTALLNEMERIASSDNYRTILLEAHEEKSLSSLLVPHLRRVLFDLDRMAGAGDKAKRGLAILKSFVGAVKISIGSIDLGLDIDPQKGYADSGDLEIDLPDLLVAVAQAAQEKRTLVAILIDEIQYISKKELSAVIMAMHKMQQSQLPLVLMAAGLPTLPGLAGNSKSYAERLFSFPRIGRLSEMDAFQALQDPVKKDSVFFEDDALHEIFRLTEGYPYFIQEWGYQTWNQAIASPITLQIVQSATSTALQRLDENFFLVRFDRLTPKEKSFLQAMAHLESDQYRTSDVAEKLGAKITDLGLTRENLIKKGMIFSPHHGSLGFTVPLFDQFMRRKMPL